MSNYQQQFFFQMLSLSYQVILQRCVFFSLVRFVISVAFRSLVPNGVLLYATNDLQNPTHFISLELVNGRLVFKYNAGYKTVKVMSTLRSYAEDGQYYTVNTLYLPHSLSSSHCHHCELERTTSMGSTLPPGGGCLVVNLQQ